MAQTGTRVAVVGVGYWGRNLARNFAELGALAAVVDVDETVAAKIAGPLGTPARSLEVVLADPDIDGVVIATRAETHYTLADAALKASKHVFVEKPLVLDECEADRLIATSAAADRILMVGHLLRYHPIFRCMIDIVRGGEFGALRYAYSDRLSLGKIRTEENVLWSFAPHDISMVLALAAAEPETVTAQSVAFVNPAIADFATMQLTFPDGVKADIRASWMHYRKLQQIVAICDGATIVFEDSEPDWRRKLSIHEHRIELDGGIPIPQRGPMRYITDVPVDEPLKLECSHFLDCIQNNARPLTDGEEGRAVLRVLHQGSLSMTEKGQ